MFFEAELGVGPAAIGAIFFLSQLAGLPATFAAPTLVRRFGPTLTILPSRIMGGSALGIMGAFISLPLAVPMFLLVRIGEVIDNPSDQHFSTQVLPRRFWARIQGLRVCGFQLLSFLGSLIGGTLILDYGYGGRLWLGLRLAGCKRFDHGGFFWVAASAISCNRTLVPITRVGI